MKSCPRIAILLLTLCLLVGSLCALPVPAADGPVTVDVHNGGSMGPKQITSDYCIRVNLGAPFTKLTAVMPTWGQTDAEASLALYKWNVDYNTTLASEPIAYKLISPLVDCATNELTFDPQPAGEYLFRIADIKGTVGVMQKDMSVSQGYCYESGKESRADWWMTVTFTEKPDTPFLPVSSMLDGIDGKHKAPAEWVPAEDHLLNTHKVMPDTWVFTDGLGRVSLTNAEVGDPKDKTVAMFYWTWHGGRGATPLNLTEFMEKYPEAKNDYNHSAWPSGVAYFWNEPVFGYYRTTDEWVLRKHAELLANAGVDTIFTDNTNGGFTWKESYDVLYPTWEKAQNEGAVDAPKVSFTLPFYPFNESWDQITSLYMDIYRPGKYHSLWFYWEGKPMLMACDDHSAQQSDNLRKETYRFFTWRRPFIGGDATSSEYRKTGQWGWLSAYPQVTFPGTRQHLKDKTVEQTTVGISQNRNYVTGEGTAMNGEFVTGRSYTSTFQDRYAKEGAEATKWGYFFAEQFDYALEIDPKLIFVTGWNEWTAGRHENWGGVENAFPDQFIDEFSRDIEPTKGALQDHYYYQLVNYVRKFKGARPIPTPSQNATIDLNGSIDQWNTVEPYYAAYIGNTAHRDAEGYGDLRYTETSGRNDIIGARVARDDEFVYFFVECNETITPYTDSLWMNLYVDCDQESQGWNTFDFVVNKSAASAHTLVLEKFTAENDYAKTEKVADVAYKADGKTMTVKIPKSALGLEGNDYTINFAWTDNVHDEGDYTKFSGDILDFYVSGDVAPGGRFKFSYVSTFENSGKTPETEAPTETPTDPVETPTDAPVTMPPTCTEPARKGCKSTLGMGVAATLTAMAAAVALRKGKEE